MTTAGQDIPRILASLGAKRRIVLIGQVVVDIVCTVPNLPSRSGDVHVERTSMDIGGSAPNIAVALNRLELKSDNLFPVGLGDWSEMIFARLAAHGIDTQLIKGDSPNGWTMALVEPDGERTFISTTGISSGWTRGELDQLGSLGDAIVYLCGYEMTGPSAETLLQWIGDHADATLVYDPGPRIQTTRADFIERLCRRRAIFTVNRQEISFMMPGVSELDGARALARRTAMPVIVRLDKDGAMAVTPDGAHEHVAGFVVDVVAHTAGVIAALACGLDLRDGLILGNAIAAKVVSKPGSMLPPGPLDFSRYLDA
jgi:sugar/nucleoside kinase (ribokinase family)